MPETVSLPGARPLSNIEKVKHEQESDIAGIAKSARTWEDGMADFEDYARRAIAEGKLFKTLPEKYQSIAVIYKPHTYDALRRKFEPLLKKELDDKSYMAEMQRQANEGYGRQAAENAERARWEAQQREAGAARERGRAEALAGSDSEWLRLYRQANAEKQKIIQDVINGTGRPNPYRIENVRNLVQRAKIALQNEYYKTVTYGSGNQMTTPPSGARKAEYEKYKRLLDGFDASVDSVLAGEGVIGYNEELGEDGSVSRRVAERGANAGYMPALRALEQGGFLVGNRGLTKDAAKSMLEQAGMSMALGGMAYIENMRQYAAILSQEGFRRSGISYAGIGSAEIARIAGIVVKAADEIFREHNRANVSGTSFWTGNAKMSDNDRQFVNSLAEGGISVEDLTRPVSEGDRAADRHIDPVKLGQAMKSAGDMFYAKRNAGINRFGRYLNLAVGKDASDLRYWRDLDPAVFGGNAQLLQEFESLGAETDWYENVYNSAKALVRDLDASSKEDGRKARAAYFLSEPPPSWENPRDIQMYEQLALEFPFIQQIRDSVRLGNRITGMAGSDVPLPKAQPDADGGNMFADGTLGYDIVTGLPLGGAP